MVTVWVSGLCKFPMAPSLATRSTSRPWSLLVLWPLLLLWTSGLHSSLAQLCTFWDGGCVDPLAQTAISLELAPLFQENINLYYAYDANSHGKGHGPMTKVGFWMRYARHINSSAINMNRTSELAMRVGNLTGTPSGGNNGCDGIWGPRCSRDLKRLLSGAIYDLSNDGDYNDNPLQTVMKQMQNESPYLENCPPQFFDVQTTPVIRMYHCGLVAYFHANFSGFSQESASDKTATIQTAGTGSSPWKTWYIDQMSSLQQAGQVAVAIFSRSPSDDAPPLSSRDDVRIELACLQAPSGNSFNDQSDS